MNHIRPLPVCLALVVTLIGADLSDASVRKCSTTRNGLPVDASAAVLVVDGQIVGTLGVDGRDRRPGDVLLGEVVPSSDNVARIDIICLEVREGNRTVGRQAVAVVTKSGAVEFMKSHLQALSELQEEHRVSGGAYADNLLELAFFDSRAPLPIELTSELNGWTAKIELSEVGTSCHVYGGSPADSPTDQAPNLVRCVST